MASANSRAPAPRRLAPARRAIKKELGEGDDDGADANDVKLLEERHKTLTLDAKAEKVGQRELRKKQMNAFIYFFLKKLRPPHSCVTPRHALSQRLRSQ